MKTSEVFGCAAWASFFLLASAWIPLFGPFFSLLTPLPFIYYTSRSGLLNGVKAAAATLVAVGIISQLTGQSQLILLSVEFSLLGLALSEIFKRKFSLGYTLLLGSAFMLSMGLLFLFLISVSKGMGPFEMLLDYLNSNLRQTLEAYTETGMSPEESSELQIYGEALIATISTIYPSLLIIGTGIVVWLNMVLARQLFKMKKLSTPEFSPLDRWMAPEKLVWVLIASGFSLFLLSGGIRSVAVNVFIVTMAVYLFHGLSILLFFMNKYKAPSWVRIGVYILLAFQQFFLAILALVGLFDQWVDFRKIHKTGQMQ